MDKDRSQRHWLGVILCLAIFTFCFGIIMFQDKSCSADEKTFTVLYIDGLSGPYAATGQLGMDAIKLFMEERKYMLGDYKAKLIFRDTELKPAVAVRRLKEALETEKPELAMSSTSSAVQLAMLPILEKAKSTIYFTAAMDDKITFKGNRFSFRNGSAVVPQINIIKDYLKANPDIKKVAGMYLDYNLGYETDKLMQKVYEELGIDYVQKQFVPYTTTDAGSFVLKAKNSGADALVFLLYGTSYKSAVKQFFDFDLKKNMKIVSILNDNASNAGLSCDAISGLITVDPWYYGLDNPWTKQFVEKFREKYDKFPDLVAAFNYNNLEMMEMAIKETGSKDPKVLIPVLEGLKMEEGPVGKQYISPWSHFVVRPMPILQGKTCKEVKFSGDYFRVLDTPPVDLKQEGNWDVNLSKKPLK